MYIIPKCSQQEKNNVALSDTCPGCPEPNPSDPWIFTDPFAIQLYKTRCLLGELKEDIQTYVMQDGWWTLEEIEFKLEVRRLLSDRVISPTASFGALSPHPTVYRALVAGSVVVSNRLFNFKAGDYLSYEPWLARYSDPGLKGPLQIGQLYPGSDTLLCRNQFPEVCIHCDRTRAEMRKILAYRNRS